MKLSERIRWEKDPHELWEQVAQLEEHNAAIERENTVLRKCSEFIYEKDYGAEFDEWLALLTKETNNG